MTTPQSGPKDVDTTSKAPASYTLVRETKYDTSNYKIIVGWVNDKELPQYLVVNKETDVVEASNEVLLFMRQWIAHFQQQLEDLDNGKVTAPPETQSSTAFN